VSQPIFDLEEFLQFCCGEFESFGKCQILDVEVSPEVPAQAEIVVRLANDETRQPFYLQVSWNAELRALHLSSAFLLAQNEEAVSDAASLPHRLFQGFITDLNSVETDRGPVGLTMHAYILPESLSNDTFKIFFEANLVRFIEETREDRRRLGQNLIPLTPMSVVHH